MKCCTRLAGALGTRLECQHTFFVRTEKALWKFTFAWGKIRCLPSGLEQATLGSLAHDFPTALSIKLVL